MIEKVKVRRLAQVLGIVLAMVVGTRTASAQQGTGGACTSGWPTNYQCEEFFWNGAASQTLWTTAQGYCYLNAASLGTDGTAYMKVIATNGNWTLQGTHTTSSSQHWGSAICVSYPGYTGYLQGSYTGTTSTTNSTKLTTNTNFCSLAGLQYKVDGGHPTSFATGAYEYPSSNTAVDLHASVQNAGSSSDIAYGECLKAPSSLWLYWAGGHFWGSGGYSNGVWGGGSTFQSVYVYSTGPGFLSTDAPAYSTNCMITQIYPVKGKAFSVDVDVEDETGNWYVYADSGVLSVQVACIMNSH